MSGEVRVIAGNGLTDAAAAFERHRHDRSPDSRRPILRRLNVSPLPTSRIRLGSHQEDRFVPIDTSTQAAPPPARRDGLRHKRSEDGAIAIMTPFVILLMIAMFGMALDLSRSYNRKAELQSVADAIALAAASALDGTAAGIDRAVTAAGQAAVGYTYAYSGATVSWSSAALTFGTDASGGAGGWMDGATAKATASTAFFARVDTSVLDASHGRVRNFLMPVLSSAFATSTIAASAVAGRDTLNVLPLAICANSPATAASLPSGELVEFGFRRGVSYNLMSLNPGGRTPENFLVNPIAPPDTVGATVMNRMDVVAPFVCTGKLAMPTLNGGSITVERGFPIGSLYMYLNSRFGTYVTPCQSSTAPADPNVRSFDLTNATWMKYRPDGLTANALSAPDPLLTVAEKPAGATKSAYGPLWSYAKAAKYASYVANGGVEPAGGYLTFSTTDWNVLYNPGSPVAQSYPATAPYQATGGSASYKPYRNTRVLNIPLLSCPVPAGTSATATVLGIGKFFMTVPATSTAIDAEFAGMATEAALGGNARLYR
jgi:Flp pilus assembly protein TadG